ncbi:hypothetical protein BDN67DRAFT_414977 [Paxillus ammoniavirescens]|nr:hypothetical protein BDN67DRAFT_414977 [Paxillus ammoniavirescens]
MEEPPPEEERALVGRQGHLTDMNMLHQSLKVSQCDEDMTLLKTSNWFIEPLEKALQTKSWPSDDKAQKGLDTQTSRLFTVAQMSRKSDQLLTNQSQCEDSKTMASAESLKGERSISPPPEGPTKGPRGAPLGSNTRS